VAVNAPAFPRLVPGGRTPEGPTRQVTVDGLPLGARVLARAALPVGATLPGPAVIEEMTATTFLPPGWTLTVGGHGELILVRAAPGEEIQA
jgi:N-methylhydantoinase A/oxoprolinase/acetone carboxylase beta subunit